jgi:hypothetical protein
MEVRSDEDQRRVDDLLDYSKGNEEAREMVIDGGRAADGVRP